MGIDYHFNPVVKPESYSTEMNYPSTTQALFALVVLIIVLLFILVYCCSGTFPCNNPEENRVSNPDPTGRRIQNQVHGIQHNRYNGSANSEGSDHDPSRSTVVIVPLNGMIYCRDQGSSREKPPTYSDLFSPPPPYSVRTVTPSPTRETYIKPPAYEESFKDWKLTLNNDNRFDSLMNDSRPGPESLSLTINELINEATLALNTRPNVVNSANVFTPTISTTSYISPVTSHLRSQETLPRQAMSSEYVAAQNSSSRKNLNRNQITTNSTNPIIYSDNINQPSYRNIMPQLSNSRESTLMEEGVTPNGTGPARTESEQVLIIPESDIFSLIREVTIAENSRRDTEDK